MGQFNMFRVCGSVVLGAAAVCGGARADVTTNYWQHVADGDVQTIAALHRWTDAANWSPADVPGGETAVAAFVADPDNPLEIKYKPRKVLLPDGEVTLNSLYQATLNSDCSNSGDSIQYLGDTLRLAGADPSVSYTGDGPNLIAFLTGTDVAFKSPNSKRLIYLHGPTDFRSLRMETCGITWFMQQYATNAVTSAETQTEPLFNPDMTLQMIGACTLDLNQHGGRAAVTLECTAEGGSPYLRLPPSPKDDPQTEAGALVHAPEGWFPEGAFVVWARNLGDEQLVRMSVPALQSGTGEVRFEAVPTLPTRQRIAFYTAEGDYNQNTFRLTQVDKAPELTLSVGRLAVTNTTIYLSPNTGRHAKNGQSGAFELEDVTDCKDARVKLECGHLRAKNVGGAKKRFSRLHLEAYAGKDGNTSGSNTTRWSAVDVEEDVTLAFDRFSVEITSTNQVPGLIKRGAGELRLKVVTSAEVAGDYTPKSGVTWPKRYLLEEEAGTLTFVNETGAEVEMRLPELTLKAGVTLRAEGAPVRITCGTLVCEEDVTVTGPLVFDMAGQSPSLSWQNLEAGLADGARLDTPDKVWFLWGQTGVETDVVNGLAVADAPDGVPGELDGRKLCGWYDENGVMYFNAQGGQVLFVAREGLVLNPGYSENLVSQSVLVRGFVELESHNIKVYNPNTTDTDILKNRLLYVPVEGGKTYLITLGHETNRLRVQFTPEILQYGSTTTYKDAAHTFLHPADITNGESYDVIAHSKLRVTAPADCRYLYVFYLNSLDNAVEEEVRAGMTISDVDDVTTVGQSVPVRLMWGDNMVELTAVNGAVPAGALTDVPGVPAVYKGNNFFLGWYDARMNRYFDGTGAPVGKIVRAVNLHPGYMHNLATEAGVEMVGGFIQNSDKVMKVSSGGNSDNKNWMLTFGVEAGKRYEVAVTAPTDRLRLEFTDKEITKDESSKSAYAATAKQHPDDKNLLDGKDAVGAGATLCSDAVPAGYNRMYVFFTGRLLKEAAQTFGASSVIVRCLDEEPVVLYRENRGTLLIFK